MHHALYIHEILLNIFGHCNSLQKSRQTPHRPYCCKADLAALAQACQTFKEPALDILWSELVDLAPLLWCIPQACQYNYVDGKPYAFNRVLSEAEWGTIRNYARRIRFIDATASDHRSFHFFSCIPATTLLFPNLRSVRWPGRKQIPVAQVAVPSLKSIDIEVVCGNISPLDNFLGAASYLCPDVTHVRFSFSYPLLACPDEAISHLICCWRNLQVVDCDHVMLNAATIVHLSRISTLTKLSFALGKTETGPPNATYFSGATVLTYPRLTHLKIRSESLESVVELFSRIRLPAIEDLVVMFRDYTPRSTIRSYVSAVRNVCSVDSLVHFELVDLLYRGSRGPRSYQRQRAIGNSHRPCSDFQPTVDDVFALTAFSNLRSVQFTLEWCEDTTMDNLAKIAVDAWPWMNMLVVNGQSRDRKMVVVKS